MHPGNVVADALDEGERASVAADPDVAPVIESFAQVRAARKPNTRLIWAETPSNPLMKIVDLSAVASIARGIGAWMIVAPASLAVFTRPAVLASMLSVLGHDLLFVQPVGTLTVARADEAPRRADDACAMDRRAPADRSRGARA